MALIRNIFWGTAHSELLTFVLLREELEDPPDDGPAGSVLEEEVGEGARQLQHEEHVGAGDAALGEDVAHLLDATTLLKVLHGDSNKYELSIQ